MELPKRKTTRLQGGDYNKSGAYFLTICTLNRRCLLSRVVGTGVLDGPNLQLTEYGKIVDENIKNINEHYKDIFVERYVIMPNHIHVLLVISREENSSTIPYTIQNSVVSRFISTFKRFCNKEIGYNIWQRGAFYHIIRNRDDYDAYIKYISNNPLNWYKDKLYTEENDRDGL